MGEIKKEWLRPTLWQNEGSEEVSINVMVNDFWYTLARVEDVQIYVWQHICLEIDTAAEEIRVARNGKILGSEIKVPGLSVNKPANIQARLVLGIFVDERLTSQFYGQVTNINIYKSRRNQGELDLVDLTSQPCNDEGDLLSWNSTTWTESGTAATWEEADETVSSNKSNTFLLNCRSARVRQQHTRWLLI